MSVHTQRKWMTAEREQKKEKTSRTLAPQMRQPRCVLTMHTLA